MIVIATHDGKEFLKNLIPDIQQFNIPNNKICIVDNQSKNQSHLHYLNNLQPSVCDEFLPVFLPG